MSDGVSFLMAGGGTGGHVIPALAVARELRRRGHQPFFVGTRSGLEARLVPPEGFPMEWIEIGGLKRVGLFRTARTLWQLPLSSARCAGILKSRKAAAVFSMGGYVAGPPMLAAWWRKVPMVLMEPNAIPGFTNRQMGRFGARALLAFEETARYFPPGRSEVSGLPVRPEFFGLQPKLREEVLTVLITGGSQGSRRLNLGVRESWPLFRDARFPVRFIHQTGPAMHSELEAGFSRSGLVGQILPFIQDMPAAFGQADVVVSRSGAGAVSELAAAGKPSILVPFPFSSDDHQLRNAEAFEKVGAARLVRDAEFTGERFFKELTGLASDEVHLGEMMRAARGLARPNAAERAADLLEELAEGKGRN